MAKKNLKTKVLDTVDGLTKCHQAHATTDAFRAYYKPIKAHYFPALHSDWLIFKYGTEVVTVKSLDQSSVTILQALKQLHNL